MTDENPKLERRDEWDAALDMLEQQSAAERDLFMLKTSLTEVHAIYQRFKRMGEMELRWQAGKLHQKIRSRIREIEKNA